MGNIVLGILAHVDAGKTTLSEGMLYLSGVLRRLGRVDHRDAFLDTDEMERKRGITIFSKQAIFPVGDKTITLLDTPGHVDFSAEMERTLQVLDYAVLVISGTDGVQGHTQTLWKLLEMYRIPTFLFVNKMDRPETDRAALLRQLQRKLSDGCIDFAESDEALMEEIAMTDEAALEAYMESGSVSEEEIVRLIAARKVFPCFFGSALKLDGVEELLHAFNKYMKPFGGREEFAAKVFKIGRDDKGERLTFLKVTGGTLAVKMAFPKAESGEEKVNQIRIYSGTRFQMVSEAAPGSVCAVTGLSATYAGQGLGAEHGAAAPFLEPVMTCELVLPEGTDPAKALQELKQLEEEEPLLNIVWNPALGEIHMQLMGEVQTEILKTLIAERFGLSVTFGPGKILYKETIAVPAVGVGHYEPLRHYAEVQLLLEPLPAGSGLAFDTACSEDVLDRNWQRLILTHLQEREHPGVLAGAPITDMKLTLVAGRAHAKHTEGGDFRQATYRAVRQGLKSANCVLLEPYYAFTMEIPSEQVGRAMSDIGQKNGSFSGPEAEDESGMVVLTGRAPASELADYQQEVIAYTKGRGSITFALDGYEPCHNEEEVLAAIGYDSERDVENPTGSVFCAHGAGFPVKWDEVPAYKHIKTDFLPKKMEEAEHFSGNAGQNRAGKGAHTDSYGEDAELLAIMEREFGKKQRERDRYGGYRRRTPPAPPSAVTFSPKKQVPKKEYLLVDGYNIIFSWEELKELAEASVDAARGKLMDILSNYQGFVGCTLILVFDAYKVKGSQGEVQRYHNIYVVYTKEAETADQYIEKTTHEIGRKYKVTVATSDALEQIIVMGQGAYRLSARDFHDEVERVEAQIRATGAQKLENGRSYLLDYAQGEDAERLERLRLGEKEPEA